MAGAQDRQTAHEALRAAAVLLALPPPPPIFPVGVQDGPGLLQPAAAAAAAAAPAVGLVPAGIPAPGAVGLVDRGVRRIGLASA
jgi:hypothetical protein